MLETYVLHITKECNCDCIYCYERDKKSIYEWEEIKALLDDIIKYNKHFSLEFLGGEPCLRIDLIEKVIRYLYDMQRVAKIPLNIQRFIITTNGTIINSDLIHILKYWENVSWCASIDGNKFMNSLRVTKDGINTYDKVIENYKKLYHELNNDMRGQLSVHLVTHPYNVGYLYDGIADLYSQGVRSFGIGTIESTMIIDDEYCKEFVSQLKKLADDVVLFEKFPGIKIGLFEGLKPKSDSRYYIKDENGKTILETYGRVESDIKNDPKYVTPPSSSNISDKIYNIRKEVYDYYQTLITKMSIAQKKLTN